MNILNAMYDSKFVHFNGHMLVNRYAVDPDDILVADDIVLEATADEGSLELTLDDVRDAEEIAPCVFRLRSGEVIGFLNPPTYH